MYSHTFIVNKLTFSIGKAKVHRMTARETEDDTKSVEMTIGPNQAYEAVDIHNQAGGFDQPLEPVNVRYQVGGQQQTVEPVYEQLAS